MTRGAGNWFQDGYRWMGGVVAPVMLGLISQPAWAQVCRMGSPTPASAETRTFENKTIGVAFDLPANYRAMSDGNGGAILLDPATFDWVQCATRAKRPYALSPRVLMEVRPAPTTVSSLVAMTVLARPWLQIYNPTYTEQQVAGQSAIAYQYLNPIYKQQVANVSLLSPDGRWVVSLSGPVGDPIWQQVLTSFEFEAMSAPELLREPAVSEPEAPSESIPPGR